MASSAPSDPPLVSVVTPCYNAARHVSETIESVLGQSHPAVEHILVDDASTDGTLAVLRGYAERYSSRVRLVPLVRNGGASRARTVGAGVARGRFLMFLDSDDVIAPSTLASLAQALEGSPDAVAFCDWERLRFAGGEWWTSPRDAPLPPEDPEAALSRWVAASAWTPPCTVLWPSEVLERVGGWDAELSYNDDGELMIRALASGVRLVFAPEGRAYYRAHGAEHTSLSQTVVELRGIQAQVRAIEKIAGVLATHGRLEALSGAVGTAYYRAALTAFQSGHVGLGRELVQKGRELGGRPAVSRTRPGRLLDLLLGLERKEQVVQKLAQYGIVTGARRLMMARRRTRLNRPYREVSAIPAPFVPLPPAG